MLFSNIQLTHVPSTHETALPHRLSLLEPAELEKEVEQELEHHQEQTNKANIAKYNDVADNAYIHDHTSNTLYAAQTAPTTPAWGVEQNHVQEATSAHDQHSQLHEEEQLEEQKREPHNNNFYKATTPSSASVSFAKYASTPLGRKRQEQLFHVDGSTSRRMSSSHFATLHHNKNNSFYPSSHKSNYLLPYPHPHHHLHQQHQHAISNNNNINNSSVMTLTNNTTPQTTNTTTNTTTTTTTSNNANKINRTNSHTSPLTSSQPWPSANISSERGHVVDSVELPKLIKRLESLNGIDKVIASEHLPHRFLMNVLSFIMFVQEILRRLRMLKCCSLICFLSVTRQTFIVADVVPLE